MRSLITHIPTKRSIILCPLTDGQIMRNKDREGLKVIYRVIAAVVAVVMIIGIVVGSFTG